MPSRADTARWLAAGLHVLGTLCGALAAWRLAQPVRAIAPALTVAGDSLVPTGADAASPAALARLVAAAPGETIAVRVARAPAPRPRAMLRALADAGHPLAITSAAPLPPLAVAAHRRTGPAPSASVMVAGSDSLAVTIGDVAGTLDSARGSAALTVASLAGAARARAATVAAQAPVTAVAPGARVVVAGEAGWEGRFVVAALEEAGWRVDAALAVAPTVVVRQGDPTPSLARHAAIVLLPGAPAAIVRAVPGFVRGGGGAVVVGDAARAPALAALRAGTPGAIARGEAGMEASDDEPRHGLDLVPVAALGAASIALETRDGAVAVAARRAGAGRVVQVGYVDSWRWRMGGADGAPDAHRRWWSATIASVAATPLPPRETPSPFADTLDPAPVAALAAQLALPRIAVAAPPVATAPGDHLPPARWLALAALVALTSAWALRRRLGLA